MSVSPYPYQFTVKPTRSGRYYFTVSVDETREQMHKRAIDFDPENTSADYDAVVIHGTHRHDKWWVGAIFFCDERIGAGIVAHEMTHAALRYIERKGVRLRHWENIGDEPHADEEALCDAVDHLNRQFWLRFNDRYFGEGALV